MLLVTMYSLNSSSFLRDICTVVPNILFPIHSIRTVVPNAHSVFELGIINTAHPVALEVGLHEGYAVCCNVGFLVGIELGFEVGSDVGYDDGTQEGTDIG